MQEDNLYQNGTQHLMSVPDEQLTENREEKNAALNELPILEQVIEMLEGKLEEYSTVLGIPKEIRLDKEKLAIRVDSNAETFASLSAVHSLIMSMAGEFMKKD